MESESSTNLDSGSLTNNSVAVVDEKVDFFESMTAPPEWLTQEYIENVLRRREKDPSLKIVDYSVVSATKPGDNFASIALRIKASFTGRNQGNHQKASFVVKVEPYQEGMKKDALSNTRLFETESSMYSTTLPEMQRLLKTIKDNEVFAPDLTHFDLNPKIVILEDLSPEFQMHSIALDFPDASKVFKKLGKFHALSYYMKDNHEPVDDYVEGLTSEKLLGALAFVKVNYTAFADIIADWSSEMAVISEKLKAIEPTLFERLGKTYSANPRGYNVLNHGDFHVKNMLLKHEGNQLVDLRFIDFQLSIWASPALDLIMALYVISSQDARDNHRDELIRIYHDQFTATLKEVGYLRSIPSLNNLQEELLRNGLLEVFVSICFLPMFYVDFSRLAELGEMTVEKMNGFRKSYYEGPVYKELLTKLLPQFLYKGFLD